MTTSWWCVTFSSCWWPSPSTPAAPRDLSTSASLKTWSPCWATCKPAKFGAHRVKKTNAFILQWHVTCHSDETGNSLLSLQRCPQHCSSAWSRQPLISLRPRPIRTLRNPAATFTCPPHRITLYSRNARASQVSRSRGQRGWHFVLFMWPFRLLKYL